MSQITLLQILKTESINVLTYMDFYNQNRSVRHCSKLTSLNKNVHNFPLRAQTTKPIINIL